MNNCCQNYVSVPLESLLQICSIQQERYFVTTRLTVIFIFIPSVQAARGVHLKYEFWVISVKLVQRIEVQAFQSRQSGFSLVSSDNQGYISNTLKNNDSVYNRLHEGQHPTQPDKSAGKEFRVYSLRCEPSTSSSRIQKKETASRKGLEAINEV